MIHRINREDSAQSVVYVIKDAIEIPLLCSECGVWFGHISRLEGQRAVFSHPETQSHVEETTSGLRE